MVEAAATRRCANATAGFEARGESTIVDQSAEVSLSAEEMPSLSRPSREAAHDASLDNMRVLKPRRAAPADAVRPTRAEVNLANLRHNLRALEKTLAATPNRAAIRECSRPMRTVTVRPLSRERWSERESEAFASPSSKRPSSSAPPGFASPFW